MIWVGAAPGHSWPQEGANPKHNLQRNFQRAFSISIIHLCVTSPSITLFPIGSVLTKVGSRGWLLYTQPTLLLQFPLPCLPTNKCSKKWQVLTQGRLLQARERGGRGGEPEKERQEGNFCTSTLNPASPLDGMYAAHIQARSTSCVLTMRLSWCTSFKVTFSVTVKHQNI